jgi:hypothetical protein
LPLWANLVSATFISILGMGFPSAIKGEGRHEGVRWVWDFTSLKDQNGSEAEGCAALQVIAPLSALGGTNSSVMREDQKALRRTAALFLSGKGFELFLQD